MKVLYVCSELFPLLKTGGLADVSAALPPALQQAGCDVRVLLPGFPSVLAGVDKLDLSSQGALSLPTGYGPRQLAVKESSARRGVFFDVLLTSSPF